MGPLAFFSSRFWDDWQRLLAELHEARDRGDRNTEEALRASMQRAVRAALADDLRQPRRNPERAKALDEAPRIEAEIDADRERLSDLIAELGLEPDKAERVRGHKANTIARLVAIVRHYRPELRGDLDQLLLVADSLRHA